MAHPHGQWGGQVFLTVPVKLMGTDPQVEELLTFLNKIAWGANDNEGGEFRYFESKFPDWGFDGGMGGGQLTDGLWLHRSSTKPFAHASLRFLALRSFKNAGFDDTSPSLKHAQHGAYGPSVEASVCKITG